MDIREPCLPPGWYPGQKDQIAEFIEPIAKNHKTGVFSSRSAISPHAGWFFSGRLAALAVMSLDSEAETVAVIGGHLPGGMPVLSAREDGARTPMGVMAIDTELRDEFEKKVSCASDRYQDNTVEVLLPMVQYFFPRAKLLWLRFPSGLASFEAGKVLYQTAASLGRRLVVLASTDLTHYGGNYGFSPKGRGKAALDWVKEVNDASFISAVLERDPKMVLKRGEEDRASCSPGAVLGALGFISGDNKTESKHITLLEYQTSADVLHEAEVPNSFVGYAAISLP